MAETWRQLAAKCIHEAFTSIKAAQPDVADAEILKMVSRNYYPWGSRENYVYKAWLLAIKDYRVKLGVTTTKDGKRELPLFETS